MSDYKETIIEKHCRLCNTIKPHFHEEKKYSNGWISIKSICKICNIDYTEIITNNYCPQCDAMNPHSCQEYSDDPLKCTVCNKYNNGFSSKLIFESEERKRKQREYARKYREKKENERREKYNKQNTP